MSGRIAAVPAGDSRPAGRLTAGRREDVRYLVFGRVLPAALFAVLGMIVLGQIAAQVEHPSGGLLGVISGPAWESLYAAFCLIPVVLFVLRPRPSVAERRLLPRMVAFIATTMLLGLALLPDGARLATLPAWAGAVSSLILLGATVGEVWALLSLGRSFGIFPAARRLVTRGPYRVVRHPLYLFEILCALTRLVPRLNLLPLAMVAAFCALQIMRVAYEDTLLAGTLPEWAGWARHTARLIPGIW